MGKRGPAPESLSKLFTLKYQQGITDRQVLAEKLGVSVSTVKGYEKRLRKKLAPLEGRFLFICPQCLEETVFEDPETEERVCHSCGLVVSNPEKMDYRLPFDTTFALESDLAVGKSLGGTLPRKGLFQVLARSNTGSEDLGLRARQIRVMAETSDPPNLAKMLERAFMVSKRFNLEGDKVFNNDLGKYIRRTYWLAKELDINVNSAAETAFWLTLRQHGKQRLMLKAKNGLKINQTLLGVILKLNHLLLTVKKEFQSAS